ncbi:hypothetical protein ACOMHN_016675 [Nucella lapillus]
MHVLHLRNLCLCLGFILNEEKYNLMPSQTFNFLGMNFNTTTMLVSPSPHRLQRLHELFRALQANLIPVRSLTPCWTPWSFFLQPGSSGPLPQTSF